MLAGRFRRAGQSGSSAYLKRLNDHTEAEHFLTDGRGIDLVTGEDRSALRSIRPVGIPLAAGPLLAQDRNDSPDSALARRPVSPDHGRCRRRPISIPGSLCGTSSGCRS